MAAIVRTVIFDQRLYRPGGLARRWMSGLTREFSRNAKAAAPKRTGNMARRIRASTRGAGARRVEGTIASPAPYTTFVLYGTAYQGRRYIYSTEGWAHKAEVDLIARRVHSGGPAGVHPGWYMTLPPPGRRFHLRVHGQRKNNFMERAWRMTGARHPSIRGLRSPL